MDPILQLNNPTNTKHTPAHPAQSLQVSPVVDDNSQEILCQSKKHHRCTFPDCDKIFRYKSELSRHSITHMTQRPLECPFADCKKTFKRQDVLKNHLRLHTGETPYKCPEPGCEQSFTSRATLKYHSLRHIERKNYACSFSSCSKRFFDSSQLKLHLNSHQNTSHQTPLLDETEKYEGSTVKVRNCEKASDEGLTVQDSNCVEWKTKIEPETVQEEEIVNKVWDEKIEGMLEAVENENNLMKLKIQLFYVLSRLMPINTKRENKCSSASDLNESKQLSDQEPFEQGDIIFVKSEAQ